MQRVSRRVKEERLRPLTAAARSGGSTALVERDHAGISETHVGASSIGMKVGFHVGAV